MPSDAGSSEDMKHDVTVFIGEKDGHNVVYRVDGIDSGGFHLTRLPLDELGHEEYWTWNEVARGIREHWLWVYDWTEYEVNDYEL